MAEREKSNVQDRAWHYSREGWPIVQKLDPRCENYDWTYGGMNLNICGCCRWFYRMEGTKRTYRCLCENRRYGNEKK